MGFGAILCVALVFKQAMADLRIASTPKRSFKCEWGDARTPCTSARGGNRLNENGRIGDRLGLFNKSVHPGDVSAPDIQLRYWEPSTFNYTGLGKIITRDTSQYREATEGERVKNGQKNNNYDQFLRSNIDNEQDNRDFDTEEGRDHLPFRTWSATESYLRFRGPVLRRYPGGPTKVESDLTKQELSAPPLKAGDSIIVPLRWNNPHSSELEVNLWIFDHAGKQPIVVPIRKPTCSGEGYQNNVIRFTIPKDFSELGSKIPGFKGCTKYSNPFCAVQIYSHSVESRTYASAFPIMVHGHNTKVTTNSVTQIDSAKEDPGLDISKLRDLCRPSNDEDAEIPKAVPRWARLVSDVYNHAYMNSDYSPYHGQQHEEISQNLQASAINKMVVGNRGELGRSIVPSATYHRLRQLQLLEDRIYKNYESFANKIIEKFGKSLQNTGEHTTGSGKFGYKRDAKGGQTAFGTPWSTAFLAKCFRCAESGSMLAQRLQTNTYIPSFQLPPFMVRGAKKLVPPQYDSLITSDGMVRIYVQTLKDLLPFYQASQVYGILYQPAMVKSTVDTMADITKFIKQDVDGKTDKGQYAATAAKVAFAKKIGCDHRCIKGETTNSCGGGKKHALINGSAATCVQGLCAKCENLFILFQHDHSYVAPLTKLALGIVAHGRPDAVNGVKTYADADGSPRFNRPFGGNEIIDRRFPTPEPKATWAQAIQSRAPTTRRRNAGGGGKRRRRRGGGRRRRSSPGGTRRRGGARRRRRAKSAALEQLFQEVRSQHEGNDYHDA